MKTFNVTFRPEPEGGFTAIVPSLPGCISFGETIPEAQKNIEEALALYLEVAKEREEVIFDDSQSFLKTISYA